MTGLSETLDRLAPRVEWQDDWADVLRRAGESVRRPAVPRRVRRPHRLSRRTVLIACVVAVAVAPLTALAAINHWWFLQAGSGLPQPLQNPTVVTRGSWSGHRWTLVAFPSKGRGLCWGVTFSGDTRAGNSGGMYTPNGNVAIRGDSGIGCGAIVGIHMPHGPDPNLPTAMYEWRLGSTKARGYPGWISGAVAGSATHVVIRWSAKKARPGILASPHEVVRVATFRTPVAGYHVRLFAAPLPTALSRQTRTKSVLTIPTSVTGTNRHGRVVACSSFETTIFGASPLSSCKP